MSEIVKGALQSVDPGQKEAAASLGLNGAQILFMSSFRPLSRSPCRGFFQSVYYICQGYGLLSVITVNDGDASGPELRGSQFSDNTYIYGSCFILFSCYFCP